MRAVTDMDVAFAVSPYEGLCHVPRLYVRMNDISSVSCGSLFARMYYFYYSLFIDLYFTSQSIALFSIYLSSRPVFLLPVDSLFFFSLSIGLFSTSLSTGLFFIYLSIDLFSIF